MGARDLEKSPTSIKMLKFAMNLTDDGMVGQQVFAGKLHVWPMVRKRPKRVGMPFWKKKTKFW